MEDGGLAVEIGLRLIGCFYLIAGVAVIRVAATGSVISAALDALGGGNEPGRKAERQREIFLAGFSVLTAWSGIALMALSTLAAPLFVAVAALYAFYLFVLCPLHLDRYDPPEPAGRRQTRNAFIVYCGATILVASAFFQGLLRPPLSEAATVLVLAFAPGLAVAIYAFRLLRPYLTRPAPMPYDWRDTTDVAAEPYEPIPPPPAAKAVTMRPSWDGNALHDAETGEVAWEIEGYEKSLDLIEELDNWIDLFRTLADPADPARIRFLAEDGPDRLQAAAQPILDRLRADLGADRVTYERHPLPQILHIRTPAVRLMADYGCDPLWYDAGPEPGCFPPHSFGLSWSLADDLERWAQSFDENLNWGDPGTPKVGPEVYKSHALQGQDLARRLRAELDATGRSDVALRYRPSDGGGADVVL